MKKKLRQVVRELQAEEREERKARRRQTPAKITTTPKCKGCGTYVVPPATMCDVCAAKRPQAPRPSIQTGPQPVPPYAR